MKLSKTVHSTFALHADSRSCAPADCVHADTNGGIVKSDWASIDWSKVNWLRKIGLRPWYL